MRKFLSFSLFICFIPFLTAQNHTVVVKGDELCSTTQSYSIEHGSQLTLQAQPDSGYVFKQWADGNTDNPRVVLVESDITYEAHYTALPAEEVVPPTPPTMHTVVVKGDELCSTTQSYSIEHGARLTLQAQPDSGYVFKQWADGNTDNPRVVLVESDITYVATYTALPNDDDPSDSDMVRCTIHMGECEKPFSQDFKLDTEIEIHAVPKEHGYFVQWSDGNTDNPRLLQLTEDVNLVAEFGTEQHSVSFLDWDGTVLQSTMVNYGEMPAYTALNPERAADAQYTYSFAGWDKELTVVTGAQTYTAQYSTTLNKYKVAFRDYDGALLQSNMVNYGEIPVYTGLEPEREATAQYSYIFTGWDKELTPVVEAVEYVAQYDSVVNQYTVSFLDWDGTVLQSTMVNYGEIPVYTGLEPERAATAQYSYTFTGWDKALTPVVEAVEYVAQYDSVVNQYTVSFLDWDGTVLQTSTLTYGDMPAYTALNPERAADAQYTYSFAGWDKELTVVTGAQTYTAQYSTTLNKYKVAFRDYDGALLQSSMVNYGEIPVYTSLEPEREATAQYSYIFTGWDKELTPVVETVEYIAQYDSVVNQYTVSFLDWDGTVLQSTMVNYGDMPSYEGTPSREATAQYTYSFVGWDKELTAVTKAQTYTAQYSTTLNQYKITFLDWDETVLQSTMVNYGEMPVYEGTPSREATVQYTYTFTGWDKELTAVTQAQTYVAQYDEALTQYAVTFLDWDETVLQSTMVNYGDMPSYEGTPSRAATAQYTYTFTGWDKEFKKVTRAQTYTAQYDSIVNQYEVSVVAANGTVSGAGTYDYGTTIYLTATANEGYRFVQWSDGNTDNPRTIVVVEDLELEAIFEIIDPTGLDNVGAQVNSVEKIFRDGLLIIRRDGVEYNAMGQKIQ